jgi:hypothetical protein
LNAFKPRAPFEGQEPVYSVQMLFPKDTDISSLKKAVSATIRKKWGEDKAKWPKNMRLPFKDGNEKNLADYKDKVVVEARSKMKPGIVDKNLQEIIEPSEAYSGCWMRATVTCFAYDKAGNKGVSFGLQNLQKVKDDEAFSGKRNAKDDFESIEELDDKDLDSEVDSEDDF